ncbi:MAG: hypothetical protein WEB50_07400 [Vicinamibacterales bacterium]
MRGIQMKSLWGGVAAGALLFTVGCGATQNSTGVKAQELAAGQPAGQPVVVSCEPHQRTLVRPVVVNGATISQIECVAADPQAAAYAQANYAQGQAVAQPVPVSYGYAAPPVVYRDLPPARVVPVRQTTTVARPVRTRQIVYDEPVRNKRSVKKSAVIIGSSAAVGAGVGALAKGKKGALIGAAIGGGGAAIWDQITRR